MVGTGSIGLRHLANLRDADCHVGVYSYRQRTIDALDGVTYERDLSSETIRKYDGVVIANNTDKHLDIAKICVDEDTPFYIEKPLSNNFNNVAEISEEITRIGLLTKVGYMMRAHPNLIFLNKFLKANEKKIFYVSANIGQWLKDWRPGTDYRECYSAHEDQGGGVIYDLIHELDIAYWLFGEMEELFCHKDKVSDLEINTEDYAQIILKARAGFTIDIKFDYLRAVYKRDLEIVMDGANVFWDYVMGTITLFDKSNSEGQVLHQVPKGFDRNTMFEETMGDFVNELSGAAKNPDSSDFHKGAYSMMLAVKSHESARSNRWIKL